MVPQITEAARQADARRADRGMERFGVTVTPEMQQRIEEQSQSP